MKPIRDGRWRIGPGPVLGLEWSRASRTWRMYAARAAFGLAVLACVWAVWRNFAGQELSLAVAALVGPALYAAFVVSQLVLITIVAPVATAGSVCQEKENGSLTLLFATDLSNAEIVLGKLAARLAPVMGLLLAGLPILMICGLLGGIDLEAAAMSYLVIGSMGVLGCVLAMTLSVWGRKTHGVLMGVYFLLVGWLVVGPILELIVGGFISGRLGNFPFGFPLVYAIFEPQMVGGPGVVSPLCATHPAWLVLVPYLAPRAYDPGQLFGFVGLILAVSGGLVMFCVGSVRRVHLGQLGRPGKATKFLRLPERKGTKARGGRRHWLPGPSLDGNPVLWREWHRSSPSLARRVMWDAYFLLVFVLYLPILVDTIGGGMPLLAIWLLPIATGFAMGFGLLLLSVAASTSLAEERARGSLDVLMTTPLRTSEIVWGKWWGIARGALVMIALPCAGSLLTAWRLERPVDGLRSVGLILGSVLAVVSLGLALATWCRSQARASTIGVLVYLAASVGWLLVVIVMGMPDPMAYRLLAGSPWFGPAQQVVIAPPYITEATAGAMREWADRWTVVYFLVSAGLFAATLATFNRCLGRVDDRARPERRTDRVRAAAGRFG